MISSLRDARLARGLSAAAVARSVHVARSTITAWEQGARSVPRLHWPALASVLELRPGEAAAFLDGMRPSRSDGVPLPGLGAQRRARGITGASLAAVVGVAPSTLSMWETAGVPVPASTIAELLAALGCTRAELTQVPPTAESPDPRPFRRVRRRAGMSIREAAAQLGISVATLARYEAHQRQVPVAVARRMALLYHLPYRIVLAMRGEHLPALPPRPWSIKHVPQVVIAVRADLGLSKVGLGAALGRSGQAVRSWEIGRTRPTPATCRRLELLAGLPAGSIPSRGQGGHGPVPPGRP